MTERMDDNICLIWLEPHLHPQGLVCPRCGHATQRLFRGQGHFPASRCRAYDGYYTLLTGTVFEKTRQRPAPPVLLLRGMTQGEPTARLARELGLSRKQLHTVRPRIQANLNDSAPTGVMSGTAFEADERDQNPGEKQHPLSRSCRPATQARQYTQGARHLCQRSAPIISIISRATGESRCWVGDHADTRTCRTLIVDNIPAGGTWLYTDEWQRDRSSHPAHATVRHGGHEWARDDGDGRREVHCNTCEGVGAALRTYVRSFQGVHKQFLHRYVATYEAMVNTTRVTPQLIQRMCVVDQ